MSEGLAKITVPGTVVFTHSFQDPDVERTSPTPSGEEVSLPTVCSMEALNGFDLPAGTGD